MRNQTIHRGLGVALVALLAGCGGGDEIPEDALTRAREASQSMAEDLMGKLFAGLDVGGPAQAAEVCADIAQAHTAQYSTGDLFVRRVSTKTRNPANRPDLFELDQLRRMEALHDQGQLPAEVSAVAEIGDRRFLRYMKPIVLMEPCLTCHGDPEQIPAEVLALMRERYPQDQATGYEAGDLRGAFSVMLRLE